MFTFLHAADIHLDSPLRGLDRYEGAPIEEIRNATRRALENLVSAAIREEVAFVILAGDLYDGDWRDFNTGLFFVGQMVKLREAGIPVFAVTGNHDAANRITKKLPLPDNVRFFTTKQAETVLLDELDVALHGQSFAAKCTTADLAKDYPAAARGRFNIGVLHTSLAGREGHDSYAPCSEDCLRSRGYDYWALGHVHRREVLAGPPTIAFPGNIQGRHIRETGPKGCLLVTVDDDSHFEVDFEPLDVLRWERVKVDLSGAVDRDEILQRSADALGRVREDAEGRLLAVRLEMIGESACHRTLAADVRQLTNELRAVAVDVGSGNIWLEKVKNVTRPIREKADEPVAPDGPIAEISAVVRELNKSPNAGEDLGIDFGDLRRKVPADLAVAVQETDSEWWGRVLREAESRLVAQLRE